MTVTSLKGFEQITKAQITNHEHITITSPTNHKHTTRAAQRCAEMCRAAQSSVGAPWQLRGRCALLRKSRRYANRLVQPFRLSVSFKLLCAGASWSELRPCRKSNYPQGPRRRTMTSNDLEWATTLIQYERWKLDIWHIENVCGMWNIRYETWHAEKRNMEYKIWDIANMTYLPRPQIIWAMVRLKTKGLQIKARTFRSWAPIS